MLILLTAYFCYCRYEQGHASEHWSDNHHRFSLFLEKQQIWDYVGDSYVHRLNQSKTVGKSAAVNSRCSSVEECGTCGYGEDEGLAGAFFNSKIEGVLIVRYKWCCTNLLCNFKYDLNYTVAVSYAWSSQLDSTEHFYLRNSTHVISMFFLVIDSGWVQSPSCTSAGWAETGIETCLFFLLRMCLFLLIYLPFYRMLSASNMKNCLLKPKLEKRAP